MVLNKHQIEASLYAENKDIQSGRLKEENPLDLSDSFRVFCEACRRGDLRVCQEKITEGVNINARDKFDYTPLILASLCGHYEVVQLLLESGALCERDTFQGERCLYNALNDRIRNLLLQYDYSKSTNPLQPFAGHITSLLNRKHPKTSDITLSAGTEQFELHKLILAARSPYFAKKFAAAPDTTTWRLPNTIPSEALHAAIKFIYFGEVGADFEDDPNEKEILTGIEKLSRHLEIEQLFENILISDNRRLARQRRTDEVERGRDQMEAWFRNHVLKHKVHVDSDKAGQVRWDRSNGIFADVLLRADEDENEDHNNDNAQESNGSGRPYDPTETSNGIPIGSFSSTSRSPSRTRKPRKCVLFPAHRAMLIRSEFFNTMFSSSFKEAQETPYLQIIPVDCSPDILEIVLTFLYCEKADFPLEQAIPVLFAADLLFIDKLKGKAAQIISTLGNGVASVVESENPRGETSLDDVIDIYDVIRAGWDTRVQRLEEFGARYIAYRLERYIDEDEFVELIKESAGRVKERQETDTIELIDDIRYYLSERFRLRFEDARLDEMLDGDESTIHLPGREVMDADAHLEKPAGDSSVEGVIRTLDGEEIDDEFAQDAMNYRILLNKIDLLLEKLKLDA
ncbi:uncharacterized protein PV09_00156 [Verruconis gallopava]|uniref:BTB domain-containing protein n=1 Tax=Verruconis gallopava TaxID=253628 RepID=A0A0D2BCT7_9PEZI|nr:uncharacterized protein PV09_00156 [Verruconis gallopava]KIW09229.1 hypothetical protein PV09_00156 [Verruconis gallopava]